MRSFARTFTSALLVAAVATAAIPANAVQSFQDRVVVADPADWTPNVLDGRVNAIVVVGTSDGGTTPSPATRSGPERSSAKASPRSTR